MIDRNIFGMLYMGISILIILIGIPLVMEKIPMNHFYGIRFKKSFESEENWKKINKYGGKQLIIWSVFLFLTGAVTFFLAVNSVWLKNLIGFAPVLFMLPPAILSYLYARKL